MRLRASHDPLAAAGQCRSSAADRREQKNLAGHFLSRFGRKRWGKPLYLSPEFAMFGLGQHCCPNSCDPPGASPEQSRQLCRGSAAGTRARRTAARTSSHWPACGRQHAAQRLPPRLKGSPVAQEALAQEAFAQDGAIRREGRVASRRGRLQSFRPRETTR